MNARLSSRRSLSVWLPCIAWLLLCGFNSTATARIVSLSLNAGEAYTIDGIDQDTTAEVRFGVNPHAFYANALTSTTLQIVAAERGDGTVRVEQKGEAVDYHVTVNAILPPMGASPLTLKDDRLGSGHEKLEPAISASPADLGTAMPSLGSSTTEPAPPAVTKAAEPVTPESESAPAAGTLTPGMTTTVVGETVAAAGPSAAATAPGSSVPVANDALLHQELGSPNPTGLLIPHQSQAPSEGPAEHTYTTDPPALNHTDALDREPGYNGKHYLPDDAISLMTGTSRVYDFPAGIRRVSVADSAIADIQVVSSHQLILVGHDAGFTTLVVWDNQGNYYERQIRTEKEGHQQVMLDVVVAEVNRTRIENQGIDISAALTKYGFSIASMAGTVAAPYTTALGFLGSPASNLEAFAPPGGTAFPLPLSSNITYGIAGQNSEISTNAFFQFLERHDLARILAEPQLLANSGEEAKFLSGGEIPIVIAQSLNTSVVFKQFGTSVVFVPTVIGKHDVELSVKPEVSKPDFSQGVQLFGFTVPAFITRRAETDVRLLEDQTLMIAGLMLDDNRATVKKVPYLGDVPYLGGLFRNTSYDHVKTELVISVTPHIVRPIPEGGELALPTRRGPLTEQEIKTEPLKTPDASRPRF